MTIAQQQNADDWEIEGRVRLDTEDYLHAWFYAPEFRTIWHYVLFLPFGFALIVVGSPVPWRQWLAYAPGMIAAVPLAALAIWAYRNHWAATSFARVGPQQIVFRFDSGGLQVRSNLGRQSFAWDALLGSVETPRPFLLLCGTARFFVVPKRAFSADDLADVAEVLATIPKRTSSPRLLRTIGVWALVCALFLVLFEIVRSR